MCIISSEKCETFQRIKIFQKWINYILILRNDKYIFLFKLILKNLVGGERTWFPYFYRRFTSNKDFNKSQNIERNLQNRTFSKFVILYPLFFFLFCCGWFCLLLFYVLFWFTYLFLYRFQSQSMYNPLSFSEKIFTLF